MTASGWLTIRRGQAPLLVSIPHAGTEIPPGIEADLVSPWLARKDADWHIERLYAFAADLDATMVSTAMSRTVIDVNRDPSGVSLYPGLAATELCPSATFDGEPLYRSGAGLAGSEILRRRAAYFDPYHAALRAEAERLRRQHPRVVIYDCHSIRSRIRRLFEGLLPHFNLGTNDGRTCDPSLSASVAAVCAASGLSHVLNGRFKGGFITRAFGDPEAGIHAIQMEIACRAYMDEPEIFDPQTWPSPFGGPKAEAMTGHLRAVLEACLRFAKS